MIRTLFLGLTIVCVKFSATHALEREKCDVVSDYYHGDALSISQSINFEKYEICLRNARDGDFISQMTLCSTFDAYGVELAKKIYEKFIIPACLLAANNSAGAMKINARSIPGYAAMYLVDYYDGDMPRTLGIQGIPVDMTSAARYCRVASSLGNPRAADCVARLDLH